MIDRVRVDQANQLRHDKPARKVLKSSRWLLLRNRHNLKPEQAVHLKELLAIDMTTAYELEIKEQCPQAEIVFDLYHVVAKYGREVIDRVRVDQANQLRHDKPARVAMAFMERELVHRQITDRRPVRFGHARAQAHLVDRFDRVPAQFVEGRHGLYAGGLQVHRRKPWRLGERLRNLTPDFMDVRRRNCSIARHFRH
ncbi:transposase [Burkholderia mallei]|uniref:transposase n=1 Tax=Burkholderia mallei TaxID=13373 RepID=UPI0030820B8B